MQTINFQCGHCRNIMGVQAAYLGKQVRCPHCQQVVLAPTQATAPVPAPVPAPAPAAAGTPPAGSHPPGRVGDEQDSIFGEQIDEDLFGSPPKSKVEFPPEPGRPGGHLQLEPTVFQVPGLSPGGSPGGIAAAGNSAPAPTSPMTYPEPGTTELSSPASEPGDEAAAVAPRPVIRAPQSNIMVTSLLIILIPYSILVTVIALILYFNQQRGLHPLEMLPDLGNPPAKRVGSSAPAVLNVRSYERYKADAALPPHLITVLGQTLRVGDLDITPTSVEQKRVLFKWRTGQYKPELSEFETLVLNLKLKNVSKDVEYRPMDIAFDYLWKEEKNHPLSKLPYTHLELANGKRFCGPFQWKPGVQKNLPSHAAGSDEYVDGQEEHGKMLAPGEEMKTVIVTDPADQVANALRNYRGKLLWRIQVRRGLVNYKDKDYSVTAVIGVQFDRDEIVKK